MIEIVPAYQGEALEAVIALSQEYVHWMIGEIRQHYPALDIREFTSEHEYDDVRKKFPGDHIPPHGALFVALHEGQAAGCVGVGRMAESICEMRTLFVRPAFRGTGVGRALASASISEARKLGYHVMRLDTLGFMEGALTLYRSLGFSNIPPYLELSPALQQYIRFLELKLTD